MPLMVDLTDSIMWSKLLHKGSADQAPAVFTSTQNARRGGGNHDFMDHETDVRFNEAGCVSLTGQVRSTQCGSISVSNSCTSTMTSRAPYEKDLFLVMSKPVLETLVVLWTNIAEDQLLGRLTLNNLVPPNIVILIVQFVFFFRLLRGFWDFITICIDFKMDQMLSRFV